MTNREDSSYGIPFVQCDGADSIVSIRPDARTYPDVPCIGFSSVRFEIISGSKGLSGATIPEILRVPDSLTHAIPKRQAEFIAGRFCARSACNSVGVELDQLPIGPERSPIWPDTLVGSVTHTEGVAASIVGCRNTYSGIGVDMEWKISGDTKSFISQSVVSPAELSLFPAYCDKSTALTILFSAKESIYKALHPMLHRYIGFHEVECCFADNGLVSFEIASALKEELPHVRRLHVRYNCSKGLVLTWCALPCSIEP